MKNLVETSVNDELEHGCGFYQGFSFQPYEIKQIINLIQDQWLERIKIKYPQHWEKFFEIGIARYHELSYLLDHGSTWIKEARMLPNCSVKKIRKMSLIQQLEETFGNIEIVDEEGIGYEEIDWRLVRPYHADDIGPFHADAWFQELGHGVKPPNNMKAIKVWVALCCDPGLNGLRVLPDSQKKTWRYHGEFRHGFIKPQIDEDIEILSPQLLSTPPGNAVVFHDKLLHAGALNRAHNTRVSMELMVFVKK